MEKENKYKPNAEKPTKPLQQHQLKDVRFGRNELQFQGTFLSSVNVRYTASIYVAQNVAN
ncbi:uncharacterized protein LOC117186902 isoform X2 [Drosophila miranda]|uniref:uncharacterized protein LOC108160819 isoform X2 n=1 Tax=Drosophila miranda TaxID=7229 RepID=UPI00143F4F0A|nr:uncharacterized protein LOC108160819 isoform X2 [Drosophila miranda]XP_033244106.1 uncharacterized protein LOC117186899 isoform X6 [Drosophila miranda]XP_033244109.1 uncharacterized protein LOC117186902 isoform X2 [Drosophila miranda]